MNEFFYGYGERWKAINELFVEASQNFIKINEKYIELFKAGENVYALSWRTGRLKSIIITILCLK